jgi:hypothetical protein
MKKTVIMSKITHNYFQTKSKRTSGRMLSLLAVSLMATQLSWGQAQVLGDFKEIDGGFEGQTNGAIAAVAAYGAVPNAWTTQGGGSFPATITEDAAVARSGNKSYVYTATGGAKYNYSPLLVNNPFVTSTATKYTIQFYNKHTTGTDAVANILQKLAYTGSGSAAAERFYNVGTTDSYAMNTWVKTYFTFTTSTASAIGTNCAGVRSVGPGTATIGGVVDDYVVYAGDLDTTPPGAPTGQTVNGLNVSWNAPATIDGVDGGGYMVVRYATSPNASNIPNANGIYAKFNTITNGGKTGTVVYTGTATSFTDDVPGYVSGSDYYEIYTVDKAFNYSANVIASALLGVDSLSFNENKVTVYKNDGVLNINSTGSAINNIKVFDIQGKLLVEQKKLNSNTALIKNLKATNQILIVKIISEDNLEVIKKVVN